jgi:hypothetical protein
LFSPFSMPSIVSNWNLFSPFFNALDSFKLEFV